MVARFRGSLLLAENRLLTRRGVAWCEKIRGHCVVALGTPSAPTCGSSVPRFFTVPYTYAAWRGAAHLLPARRGGDRMEDPLHESGHDVPAVGAGHVAVIGMADLERASDRKSVV